MQRWDRLLLERTWNLVLYMSALEESSKFAGQSPMERHFFHRNANCGNTIAPDLRMYWNFQKMQTNWFKSLYEEVFFYTCRGTMY